MNELLIAASSIAKPPAKAAFHFGLDLIERAARAYRTARSRHLVMVNR